jgi:hypothetical protein
MREGVTMATWHEMAEAMGCEGERLEAEIAELEAVWRFRGLTGPEVERWHALLRRKEAWEDAQLCDLDAIEAQECPRGWESV